MTLLLMGLPFAARSQEVLSPAAAFAAQADAVKESVTRRTRPEFEPLGLLLGDIFGRSQIEQAESAKAGLDPRPRLQPDPDVARTSPGDVLDSLLLKPSFQVDTIYDDNIFRSETDRLDDTIFVARPELALQSDWLNHAFDLTASGAIGRHVEHRQEDFEDYTLGGGMRLDLNDFTVLNAAVRFGQSHVARGSADDAFEGPEPSIDRFLAASADWRYQADAMSGLFTYGFRRTDSEDNEGIDRDALDNDTHSLAFRIGYEVDPGTTVWVQPQYDIIEYEQSADSAGFNRDNEGWRALAGITLDYSAVSFFEIGAGYVTRTFDDRAKDDFADFALEARFVWNVRPLITLEAEAGRQLVIQEDPSGAASVVDSIELSAAWDPLENLILDASIEFARRELEALPGFEETSDELYATIGMRYFVTANIFLRPSYDYVRVESTTEGDDYESNVFTLRAGLRL